MPWHRQAKKDVLPAKSFGELEESFDPKISEWGNPTGIIPCYPRSEYIRRRMRHLPNWNILVGSGKEIKRDSLSSGERTGTNAQTNCSTVGVVGPIIWLYVGNKSRTLWKVRRYRVIAPYAKEKSHQSIGTWVGPDTWNPVWIWGDHSPRLNTRRWPIVNQYREGKAKRTLVKGVK